MNYNRRCESYNYVFSCSIRAMMGNTANPRLPVETWNALLSLFKAKVFSLFTGTKRI